MMHLSPDAPVALLPSLLLMMVTTLLLLTLLPENVVFASGLTGGLSFAVGLLVTASVIFGPAFLLHRARGGRPARFFRELPAALRKRNPERRGYALRLFAGYAVGCVFVFVAYTRMPAHGDLVVAALVIVGYLVFSGLCVLSRGTIDGDDPVPTPPAQT